MTHPDHSVFADLTLDLLPDLTRLRLDPPRKIEVRRSLGDGVFWLVCGAILLTLGSLDLRYFGQVTEGAISGLFLVLAAAWYLGWGLVWVTDRAPVLTLGAEELRDSRGLPGVAIPWSSIARASLSTTSRNYNVESAVLTLFFNEAIHGRFQLGINLANLDLPSHEIFALIGERANLSA